jgi:hypothetical protein
METSAILELGGVIFGLTEMIKRLLPEKLQSKLAPLVAVLVGGGMNVYMYGYSAENVVYGLMLGLAASGLYGAGKDVLKK